MRKRFVTALIIGILTFACAFGFSACNTKDDFIPVGVTGITLNKTELSLDFGGEETLIATVQPENATDKAVIWTSSDESVATVENGKVNALKVGVATITAKAGEFSATCELTVNTRKLTEDEWKSAINATLNARDLTLRPVEGEFSMEIKFDWDNKILCQGDEQFTVSENGKYYSYSLGQNGWRKSQLNYTSDEEMFKYVIDHSYGGILDAAKDAYSDVGYNAEKDEYTVNIYSGEDLTKFTFKFEDGKVSKCVEGEGYFIINFYDYGNTTVTLPEEAKNAE